MISTYQQLCPVLFGAGAVGQLADKVKELGGRKAFCIFDAGVKTSGIADRIIKILEAGSIAVELFDGVQPDAPIDLVNAAGQQAKDAGVDVVIGIGGGSSLDTAKSVAVLVDNPLPITLYYAQKKQPQAAHTPLILIPTAAGTGSEVTIMSVLHDEETQGKETVLKSGTLAIVDPELTLTVPPQVTAATGLDAMSHAIESYTTNCGNPKADILSLAAVELIASNLEAAYTDGSNLDARTNLCLASNLAGMSFNDASVHFGHAAAHEFGIQFHMPHGVACALTLPEVVTYAADVIPDRVKKIAAALGLEVSEDISGEKAAALAAEKIRSLMRAVGIRSLKEQGISREEAVACAKGAVEKNWFVICALKPIDIPAMEQLIGQMYDNYL